MKIKKIKRNFLISHKPIQMNYLNSTFILSRISFEFDKDKVHEHIKMC